MSSNVTHTTAPTAGQDKRVLEWVATREKAINLKVLVGLYESLRDVRYAFALDKRIAAEQTRRHLAGPSASEVVSPRIKNEGMDVCWRDNSDVMKVIESNLTSLRGGL